VTYLTYRRGRDEAETDENRQRAIDAYREAVCGICKRRVRQDCNKTFYEHECVRMEAR
jgi:hypothetical protein